MHVVVVGAGVVGVTTAYYLSEQGCKVTVIDQADDVADGASFGNGGQLSYSFTDALAKPDFLTRIPALLAGRDPGSELKLVPELIPWGIRFLLQCTNARAKKNTVAVLKTAMRSAQLMRELRNDLTIDFSHRAAGKLVLISNTDDLKAAKNNTRMKRNHGCDIEILTHDAALTVEPALASLGDRFIAAVYSGKDEVADARLFTIGLTEWLRSAADVTFKLGIPVKPLTAVAGRLKAVRVGDEEIAADATVICTGAWSNQLLRPLGINPHIFPVRGYSVTLPPGEAAPSVSVTAPKQRIVYSRINGSMRIAGFADFKGFSNIDDSRRIEALVETAKKTAPAAADYSATMQRQWGGFRPMTPTGQPWVGGTAVKDLYLNTGHGMLGWTLACATGYDIAAAVVRPATRTRK